MIHLIQLVVFVLNIAVSFWIYGDAQKRGMNAILWAILSFLFCPIATIIYLIVRK